MAVFKLILYLDSRWNLTHVVCVFALSELRITPKILQCLYTWKVAYAGFLDTLGLAQLQFSAIDVSDFQKLTNICSEILTKNVIWTRRHVYSIGLVYQ